MLSEKNEVPFEFQVKRGCNSFETFATIPRYHIPLKSFDYRAISEMQHKERQMTNISLELLCKPSMQVYVIRIWSRGNARVSVARKLTVNITVFWNVTPCRNFQPFRGIIWLPLFSE
jgi:hypothetical protein